MKACFKVKARHVANYHRSGPYGDSRCGPSYGAKEASMNKKRKEYIEGLGGGIGGPAEPGSAGTPHANKDDPGPSVQGPPVERMSDMAADLRDQGKNRRRK